MAEWADMKALHTLVLAGLFACVAGIGPLAAGEAEPPTGALSVPRGAMSERIVRPFDKTDPVQIKRYYDQLNKEFPVDRDGNAFPMGDGCLPPAPWLPLLMKPKIS